MEIKKEKNSMNTYDFYFKDNNKTLVIMFARNLDLYMMLSDDIKIPYGESVSKYFDITKENYEVFKLLEMLYNDIITGNLFDEELKYDKDYTKSYEYSILVDKDKNINWISDDDSIDLADSVKIIKIDNDTYRLAFYRNGKSELVGLKHPYYISVRFRNSGSRYNLFNCVFMRMYNKLQEIDPDYHQIHMEEIKYLKKVKK